MSMTPWQTVLRKFLEANSADAQILEEALMRGWPGLVRKSHGERICGKGDPADCFWLIVEGRVTIESDDGYVRDRGAGELIGEQAFLRARAPNGTNATRTADLIAHGPVSLARFDAAVTGKFDDRERSLWFELLANVLSEKLTEATEQRAALTSDVAGRNRLLQRFCDDTALATVEAVLDGKRQPDDREVVIWFSDIAGFSAWSRGRPAHEVAGMTSELLGLQVDAIRAAGGEIDKLMGDGLMAFWFCDGSGRAGVPAEAYRCARMVDDAFRAAVRGNAAYEGLKVRIGLHCGMVCFGDFGTPDRIAVTIIGETVNHGSRYEQVHDSALGAVRISVPLYERVLVSFPAIAGDLKGPVEAMAKDGPIRLYSNI